jgi:hypothetical protein
MRKVTIFILEPEVEENIFENPTFENKGLYIYAGVGIFIVILILFLLSLLMYYKNKGGIFGVMERKLERRRRLAQEKRLAEEGRVNQIEGIGLTVGQEEFYQELYGVHPSELQQMPMPIHAHDQPFPSPPGIPPGHFTSISSGTGSGTIIDADIVLEEPKTQPQIPQPNNMPKLPPAKVDDENESKET